MRNRWRPYVMILVLVFIGVARLVQTLGQERMSTIRGVDVVSLTGAGFALGVAFGLLMTLLIRRPNNSDGSSSARD